MKRAGKKVLLYVFAFIILCASILIGVYFYLISAPSKEIESKIIYIDAGSTYSTIASKLKENNLIRSELAYKIYIKLNPPKETLKFGNYVLKSSYDLKEMISIMEKGSVVIEETVKVTFIEGKNIKKHIEKITTNFNITEEEVLNKLNDESYIDTLINDYWFLTDEIKNKDIKYSLEGYLYPETYEFYKSADVDDIIRKMLNQTDKVLSKYKEQIEQSKYSVHELLTMASIVEHEAILDEDRPIIASVFYNRLKKGMKLQSCATVGYAIDEWKLTYTQKDLDTKSPYNTYYYTGLPVGPGNSPSEKSIKAAINPSQTDYLYFMADICSGNKKTYFSKTYKEHSQKVDKYLGCL